MSNKRIKEYDELSFTDDFLFCKILEENEELCKELLELILGKKIRKINYLTKQKVIDITYDGKGVRLDVYLEDDENTVFDIEMQTTACRSLPKRTRYYQGMIDLNLIERGAGYEELKKSYIIFICMQNPFGQNDLHLYTFENRCNENNALLLGDESTKVILTPDGSANDVSKEISDFLNYLTGKGGNSEFVTKLDAAVRKAKNREEWRLQYMTLQMKYRELLEEGREEGRAEGKAEGKAEGIELGRIDAIQRMIRKSYSKEDIMELGYSEDEYAKAQAGLCQMV